MASSDEEYEEIEEEIEVEEEVEVDVDEEDVVEEEVEDDEEPTEEEEPEEEPEEDPEEEPEEEDEVVEEEEEEYEEVEVEEEVEIEEEVTDDDDEIVDAKDEVPAANNSGAGSSDSPAVAVNGAIDSGVKSSDLAAVVFDHANNSGVGSSDTPALVANPAIDSGVGSSGTAGQVAEHPLNDASPHVDSKRGEVHLRSGCPELMGSLSGCLVPDEQRRKGKELLFIRDESSKHPYFLKHEADSLKTRSGTVKEIQGHVEQISSGAVSVKDNQGLLKQSNLAVASEKLSVPGGTNDQLSKINTVDIEERVLRDQTLHLLSSENTDQMGSRLCAPKVRPRDLSPGAEYEVRNKRPAMICDYFAKGWCIKGNSCRFRHERDQVDDTGGSMLSTRTDLWQGSGDATDALKSLAQNQLNSPVTNNEDSLPKSSAGRHSSKHEVVRGNDKIGMFEREMDPLSGVASSLKVAKVDMFNDTHLSDHNSPLAVHSSVLHSKFLPNYKLSSYAIAEESAAMRRQYAMDLHNSPSCGSSKSSSSALRNASLLHNSSWKDLLTSYKHKMELIPYNWEPSAPFRPSYLTTSLRKLSSDAQYDPLRDSIEQPDIARGSFRLSSCGQTQGSGYQDVQSKSGRSTLESPKNLRCDVWDKNYDGHGKDACAVEAESAAVSATDAENKNINGEKKPVVASSVKDVLKATRSTADGKYRVEKGELGHHEWTSGKTSKSNDLDEEESRVIKHFRAALVEFVKDLLKPVWHEGRLSKDVYKVIVQKAEDKILSTLPLNEVPNSSESIKQYLSSSRLNILKLIQAYVDKYGKY